MPLLLTPPMINKYYIADLAPGRSMMEYAVKHGQQVFAISWRNPTERHADWDLDTYAGAVLEALETVEEITGADSTHVMGLCAGGIVLSTVVAHLAAKGEQDRIAGLTLGVTVLDQHNAGTTGAFMGANTAMAATADSARKGYLSGRSLAGVFAWLRPNDLIWNYWVSNYLMGKKPPAFDILFWNADATNLPAALHRDFLDARAGQPAHRAGRGDRARHAGRPLEDHGRHVRRGRHRRPHHAVAERLPHGQPARLRAALRALHERAHRRAGEPAGQREVDVPPQRRAARGARGLARERAARRPARGGTTGWPGSASARGRRRPRARRSAAAATSRSGPRRAATCASSGVPKVRVNGTQLHYERSGAGEPLLLVTGFTISSAVFEPVLDLYGERFECILYDNRGSGRSGAPLRPTSMAELAADAAALLRALDVDSAHVCGLSMGGMIAQELAIRFPERVRGLVLGGTTPGGPRAARPALRELGALGAGAAGGWTDRERAWLGEWVFSEEFRREQPDRVRELLRNFGRHRAKPQGVLAHWWASRLPRHALAAEVHPGADARHARRARRDGPDLQRAPARRADPRRRAGDRPRRRPRLPARAARGVVRAAHRLARSALPVAPGRARTGVAARAEPVTRALGLPIGAARTGASLAGAMTDRLRRRGAHVATDR